MDWTYRLDGEVIVGIGSSDDGIEAMRWTQAEGMVGLGDLDGGGYFSRAWGVSDDGSIVVGDATTALGSEAFIWDEVNGMQPLQDVLTGAGLDLTGWQLGAALGVSGDGTVIWGNATNPDGNAEGWIAHLGTPVPEPGSSVVCFSGLALGVLMRRRRRPSLHKSCS